MAPTIRVLSDNMVSKIAAGEVIERPASVVKELVENSIDAGAGSITVHVVEGGRHVIRVADDGDGMTPEDVELAVARHATSKLRSSTDLFDIATLGFRGEALASMAAVSRLTIESRHADEDAGSRLIIEGGIRRTFETIGRSRGTTVQVRNIFFNTPARRKFLRRVDTELRHTTQVVSQLSAAYPEVGFELSHGERTIVSMHAGSPAQRAAELLTSNSEQLIEVTVDSDELSVRGFLNRPDHCGRSKSKQFIVVGGRPVFARSLNQAVYRAYAGLHPKEIQPAFLIWLSVQPRSVDMNVHPSKREVRIDKEWELAECLERAVRDALTDANNGQGPAGRTVALTDRSRSDEADFQHYQTVRGFPGDQVSDDGSTQLDLRVPQGSQRHEGSQPVGGDPDDTEKPSPDGPIWQVHRKYIMVPVSDGLMVVDQHVAHERVRYEEALDCFELEKAVAQQLLFPLTVSGDPTEMAAIRESQELLNQLGFGVRDFGPNSVIVDSIPANLHNWDDGALFHKIVAEIIEERAIRDTLKEAVAASYACHTSIRAGDKLSEKEMRVLLERLLESRKPNVCPHGRPIIVRIPLTELDRHFERS